MTRERLVVVSVAAVSSRRERLFRKRADSLETSVLKPRRASRCGTGLSLGQRARDASWVIASPKEKRECLSIQGGS